MKRQSTLAKALPIARIESDRVKAKLAKIAKLVREIEEINKKNSWLRYTSSGFSDGASFEEQIELNNFSQYIKFLDNPRDILIKALRDNER